VTVPLRARVDSDAPVGERTTSPAARFLTVAEPFCLPVENRGVVTPVEQWEAALEAAGELSAEVVEQLLDVHGERGARAIEAVAEERVKEYKDFTVVVGHEDEYVVEDGGCQCRDSQYNLDADDPTDLCWHVIATKIARRVDAVDYHDMWYSEVREFL
jgi:predicted nucleic acid-binding Zn finger protein